MNRNMTWHNNLNYRARHYLAERASRYIIPPLPWMSHFPSQQSVVREVLNDPRNFNHGWIPLKNWMKRELNFNLGWDTYKTFALKHARNRRRLKRRELKKKREDGFHLYQDYRRYYNMGDLVDLYFVCKGNEGFFLRNHLWIPRDTSDNSFKFFRMLKNKKPFI